MNAEDPRTDDESILTRLVACDEALAAGTPQKEPPATDAPVEQRPRLEGDLACIQVLRKVLPRRSTGAMPGVPASGGTPVTAGDLPFKELGRFQLRRRLGQGAFGIVFLAHDPQLGREVALKMPRPEALVTGELRERFVREARAAAGLDHPNLVPVYEAGAVGPLCYIASAYCPGITLSEWLKERPALPPERQAAGLVATLADAVSHAHSRGVIHRDLKPSNVLLQGCRPNAADSHSTIDHPLAAPNLADVEQELVPRITDFGLAKLIGSATALQGEDGVETRSGAVLGTPSYMAPEQASGKNKEIGPAADTYALGAILYELLAGRPPFRGESLIDTLLQVRNLEPLPPGRLRSKLSRDLETICLKCLQKEPSKRYESAAALAEDLRCYLTGKPIRARPIPAWERGFKWARRRPALAALWVIGILAPLVVSGIVLGYNAKLTNNIVQLKEARDAEIQERQLAQRESQRAKEREWDARNLGYVSDMNLAQQDWAAARVGRLNELLQRQLPPPDAEDLRGFEWYYWRRLLDHPRTLTGHTGQIWCVACSPDGKLLASGGVDHTVHLWDAVTGRHLDVLNGSASPVVAVAFVEGTQMLMAARQRGLVDFFDVETRKLRLRLPKRKAAIVAAAVAPDQQTFALALANGRVEIWDLREKAKPRTEFEYKRLTKVTAVAFSADGTTLACGGVDGSLQLRDAVSGKPLVTSAGPRFEINSVAFAPDGKRWATASADGAIRLWDREGAKEPVTWLAHAGRVWSVRYAPDGKKLVSAGADMTVRVWDAAGGLQSVLKGHDKLIRTAIFSPDDTTIVSAGEDGLVKVWESNPEYSLWNGHAQTVTQVAFTQDQRDVVLATGGQEGLVKLWDPVTHRELAKLPSFRRKIQGMAFAPDGKHLAVVCSDPFVYICDRQIEKEIDRLEGHTHNVTTVAFSPDGERLASGDASGSVRIWDWKTRKSLAVRPDQVLAISGLAFSPDGRLLATALGRAQMEENVIQLLEPATGRLVATLPGHKGTVWGLAFSPDSGTLASGGDDSTIRLWDVNVIGRPPRLLSGQGGMVRSLAFSPDGRTLASTNGEVKLWQTTTGRELASFVVAGNVFHVAWDPAGQFLAGGGQAAEGRRGFIALWRAAAKPR